MLNAVKDELLDYATFVNLIKNKMTERMGQGYKVKIYKIMKNNSLEHDSLVMLKEGRRFAPNIYLSPYYESYTSGTPIKEIIDRLTMIYSHCAIPVVQENFEYSLKVMKPFIFFRLISRERNKKLLSRIPHMEFLDLAVTFHCLVRNETDGIGTIRISDEHMKRWDITLDQLKELAFKNTIMLFPQVLKTMEEVIRGLAEDDCTENDDFEYEKPEGEPYSMYILTNEKAINGASCLLYKNIIREFARSIESDLYILPSSIHEIILIPVENPDDREHFEKMVREINSSQVPEEEVLSDRVYIYLLEKDTIIM